MPVTVSKLISRREVAEGTMAFHFEKPSSWQYQAGQFVDMTLLDPPETDAEGDIRSFSLASAPWEETLMVATRMRDTAFKRVLSKMPFGSAVKIEGPSGSLTLHDNVVRAAVLMAGGIGITPFRSMVVQAARDKSPQRICLFYSNHRPEDAPFLDELQALEKDNPNYRLIASMTEMANSHRTWQGETGHVDSQMLSRHLQETVPPIYYVAGPPEMVKGLVAMLRKAGVAEGDIRAEEFDGY